MELMAGFSVEGSGVVGVTTLRTDTGTEISDSFTGSFFASCGDVDSFRLSVARPLLDETLPSIGAGLALPVRSMEGVNAGGVEDMNGFSIAASNA
jgi:hypothetical protein